MNPSFLRVTSINKVKFYLIGIVVILFVSTSIYLTFKVNELRNQIEHKNGCVSTTKEIEKKAFTLLIELEDSTITDINPSEIEWMISKSNSYKPLSSVVRVLEKDGLNNYERLIAVKTVCSSIIEDCRAQLADDSNTLNYYWNLTHIVLIIACFIAFYFIYAYYKIVKTRKQLDKQTTKANLLFDNSVDNIISCDSNGIISELNTAAEKALGYKANELIGNSISILYDSNEDLDRVMRILQNEGVYNGEIINVKKNGEKMVAFLSANLIYNKHGDVIGSMGISRDITKQKEEKQQYQNMVENSTHVIYTIDTKGVYTFVNSTVTKLFGYKIKEVVGKSFLEFVHEDEKERVAGFYYEQLKRKKLESYLIFKGKDYNGKPKWVEQFVRAILSPVEENKIIGFQGLLRDIDELQREKIRLEQNEVRYRELFKNSTDLIHAIKPNGEFIYVNNAWKTTLNYTDEEIANTNLLDLIHINSIDHCKSILQEIVTSGKAPEGRIDYDIVTKNGSIVCVEGAVTAKKEKGEVVAIHSFLRDVTEQRMSDAIIKSQNKEIHDSISYAQSIQKASLPSVDELNRIHLDNFILYLPKDKLSGDFYDIDRFKTKEGQEFKVFAVADCTGHGIPGGMLSFLCASLLRESLTMLKNNVPSESIEIVREKLVTLFRSTEDRYVRDGMDIALCFLDLQTNDLYFSGANLNLIVIKSEEVYEYKGDRQHVGYNHNKMAFTYSKIKLESGDCFYISSDGFKDQFGGNRGKKYMAHRFKEKLLEIHYQPMSIQCEILQNEFNLWKNKSEQTDDVTVMGIKV